MSVNQQLVFLEANRKVLPQVLEDLHYYVHQQGKSIKNHTACGDWARVGRGIYLNVSQPQPEWKVSLRVALARCIAAMRLHPELVLTGLGAALLWGYPLQTIAKLNHLTMITKHPSQRRSFSLPAVRVRTLVGTKGNQVAYTVDEYPPCKIRVIYRKSNDLSIYQPEAFPGQMLTSDQALLDVARTESTLVSLTMLDAHLAITANTVRTCREHSQPPVEQLRQKLLEAAGGLENIPGTRKAKMVISAADGFSESPLESWARWHLLRLGHKGICTQWPVEKPRGTGGGYYFADLALPEKKILVEVDGFGKYGTEAAMQKRAFYEQNERQNWLETQGFEVIRWTVADLCNPVKVENILAFVLAKNGFKPPRPAGGRWERAIF